MRGAHGSPTLGRAVPPCTCRDTVLQHTREGPTRWGRSRRSSPEGAFWGKPRWPRGPGLGCPRLGWSPRVLGEPRSSGAGTRVVTPLPPPDRGHRPPSLGTARPVLSARGPSRGVPALGHADTLRSGRVLRWPHQQGLARGGGVGGVCPGLGGSVSPARPVPPPPPSPAPARATAPSADRSLQAHTGRPGVPRPTPQAVKTAPGLQEGPRPSRWPGRHNPTRLVKLETFSLASWVTGEGEMALRTP